MICGSRNLTEIAKNWEEAETEAVILIQAWIDIQVTWDGDKETGETMRSLWMAAYTTLLTAKFPPTVWQIGSQAVMWWMGRGGEPVLYLAPLRPLR
ncbi:MAG: hypothetical protein WCO84_09145 [bacterium]